MVWPGRTSGGHGRHTPTSVLVMAVLMSCVLGSLSAPGEPLIDAQTVLRHTPPMPFPRGITFWDTAGQAFHASGALSSTTSDGTVPWVLPTTHPTGATLAITTTPTAAGVLSVHLTPPAGTWAVEICLPAAGGEHFYGLGARFGRLDLVGQIMANWTADQAVTSAPYTSYSPMPFVLSSRGYGLLADTTAYATFDLRHTRSGSYCICVTTGALTLALIAGPHGGLSGWPYWGPDIGGFSEPAPVPEDESAAARAHRLRAEKELWSRWVQLGALSPTMRDMLGAQTDPVTLWTDDETLQIFRLYARLHTALQPYLYRYAHTAHTRGLPILRPLFLNYPEDVATYTIDDEYLIGDDLLVAPVLAPGQTARMLYLPTGLWCHYWTGDRHTGPGWIMGPAPLHQIPLFIRAGAALQLPALAPVTAQPLYDSGASPVLCAL